MWYDDERYFNENIKIIPVTSVMLSPNVARAVKRWGGKINENDFEKEPNPAPTPLKQNLKDCELFNGTPIRVREHGDFYSIVDGRHRFASLLSRGFKNVSVEIIS